MENLVLLVHLEKRPAKDSFGADREVSNEMDPSGYFDARVLPFRCRYISGPALANSSIMSWPIPQSPAGVTRCWRVVHFAAQRAVYGELHRPTEQVPQERRDHRSRRRRQDHGGFAPGFCRHHYGGAPSERRRGNEPMNSAARHLTCPSLLESSARSPARSRHRTIRKRRQSASLIGGRGAD